MCSAEGELLVLKGFHGLSDIASRQQLVPDAADFEQEVATYISENGEQDSIPLRMHVRTEIRVRGCVHPAEHPVRLPAE